LDPAHIWRQLLIQFFFIFLNAFFAATEIAVVSLNDNKVRRRAEDGDQKSKKLLKLIEKPTNFLATIQIGITLAGFLGSAFAADYFADYFAKFLSNIFSVSFDIMRSVAVVIITIILSFFTLVLGELIPKRVGMKYCEKIAYFSSGIVSVLSVILRPVIWLTSGVTNVVLRIFGIKPEDENEEVTEEEIRMMVDIGEEKGSIESNEKEMIENIFEFNNSSASDIMVHRTDMTSISADESVENIVSLVL